MKKIRLLLITALSVMSMAVMAQSLTITNPVLSQPFQVPAGTVVTFEWDAWGSPPSAIYTHPTAPVVNQYLPPDPLWTSHTNFTANGNGTYSINLTINNDLWVFGGMSSMLGWQYSNVIAIQTISSYQITASDSLICSANDSVTFQAPGGTGFTYQWYSDTTAIAGATDSTYYATAAGSYHCVINDGTGNNVTNTITINNYNASFTGALGTNQITFTADQTFVSYQWLERTATGTLTPISGATSSTYTANITSTLKYYALEGTTASGCAVTSIERPVIDTMFNVPVLTLYATQNSQGYICSGTPVSIAANGASGTFTWFKDNVQSYFSADSININGAYQNGVWHVQVSCPDWPEIAVVSNSVTVSILQLIQPSITGANYWNHYCSGDVIPMILTDEGYTYTWYLHDTANVYNSNHIISVPTGAYQHNFTNTTHVTIEGAFNGCTTSKTIKLKSWSEKSISVYIDNYDQQYLCQDSTVGLYVPTWVQSDFTNYQWYENISGTWTIMPGDTNTTLTVTSPGEYKVEATPIACSTATVSSYPKTVHSYLDRQPSIYTLDNTICEGDTTTLQMSGSSNWYAIQWLEADIVMGPTGYEKTFSGMLTNTGTDTQPVTEWNSYRVSAKHNTCPNGLKTQSNIVFITPEVHPEIILSTPMQPANKHFIEWDSTEHVIGCTGEPVTMTLTDANYDSIYWYECIYMGDDDYMLGNLKDTGLVYSTFMDAIWVTAVVVDQNGCRGQSTPILLDGWAFQSPAIASSNNNELCNPGDSALIHIAFPGQWDSIVWYRNGVPMPNTNDDSLWVKDIGTYVVECFPTLCPHQGYSSGLGPTFKMLYAEILENDSLLYAMPELGFYTYQWFYEGDSVDAPIPNLPWIFPKDSLQNGTYTVAVSNANCTKISPPYVWNSQGMFELAQDDIRVYPNPATDKIYIINDSQLKIEELNLFDLQGRMMTSNKSANADELDLTGLSSGNYLLRIKTESGVRQIMISKL